MILGDWAHNYFERKAYKWVVSMILKANRPPHFESFFLVGVQVALDAFSLLFLFN